MADEPQKPTRRRRWLIASLLLALVSFASWRYWPRIDQSLIGKWTMSTSDTTLNHGAFWLKEDGTGLAVVREPRGGRLVLFTRSFNWRVEGSSFVILRPSNSGIRWWDTAMGRAYEYTKNPIFLGRDRYSIARNDADSLELTGSSAISKYPTLPAVGLSLTRQMTSPPSLANRQAK